MYDELTEVDIRKMREEIDYRVRVLRPKLIEDVQSARPRSSTRAPKRTRWAFLTRSRCLTKNCSGR